MNILLSLMCAGAGALGPVQDTAPRGVTLQSSEAAKGYVLIAPLKSTEVWLVNMQGQAVHSWKSDLPPGQSAELLPNGHLLRTARSGDNSVFGGGGEGGRLQRFDWEGNLLWNYSISDEEQLQHHDFEPMPNGNVLYIIWESKSRRDAAVAGRRLDSVTDAGLWPDALIEVRPDGPTGAEVVWEWHAWDHLIQNTNPDYANYGDPAEHPERIDVNVNAKSLAVPETEAERREREQTEAKLRAIGYAGDDEDEDEEAPADARAGRRSADWMHTNAVDYDAELDLIAISLRGFSEILVIDHSTSTAQAAGSTGGKHGHGGDILWRWGQPSNYGRGGAAQRTLFGQHDVRWTRFEGAAALSVYNNGEGRAEGDYSSVDLIRLPLDKAGHFVSAEDAAFGPEGASWSYGSGGEERFYSSHISGAQPMDGGHFLVCVGQSGRVFEVDQEGHVLWNFESTFKGDIENGPPGGRGRPRRGPRGGEGRPPGPPGERGERGGRPGGRRGPGGPGGGMSGASLFRVQHIPLDHPALVGRSLSLK